MKVYIGPYTSDLIPVYQWERSYEMWRSGKFYLEEEDYKWYDKIVMRCLEKLRDLVSPINRWSNSRKRNVKVRIDNYDVWGADHTLAMIIAPTLKKLKANKQGAPLVEDEDVPEELRLKLTQQQKDDWDDKVDANHNARWEWVLDEMIWAFEQHADPDDGEDQYHHNNDQLELVFTPLADNPKLSSLTMNYQKDPSKPAYWVDEEGKKKHYARKANGVRLFAKYYEGLWD